ncbi:MAG: LysR family transcriptional regulator [Alphaproteobacteria bacterium]|jgi:fluoroacetyl-CoA thioesterase
MKNSLQPGLETVRRVTIDIDRTIGFMGEEMRVYATPSMVLDIERTCKDLLQEHLDASENSVGARVEIDHLGATLNGMWVDIAARVEEIDRRRVTFGVEVTDELGDRVGACRHTRFVVDLDKQKERLDAKRARLDEARA